MNKGEEPGQEDIVMDEEQNQNRVIKCPITGKEIVEMAKNTRCDHIYEKSAILHYIKTKSNKR